MKTPSFRIFFLPALLLVILLGNSCKKSASSTDAVSIPTITTESSIINLTSTTAQSGGTVTSVATAVITANGVCYSTTNTTPTISDSKTSDPSVGLEIADPSFISRLTGLTPNTTYYLRAYATNATGTGYGSVIKFTTSSDVSAVTSTVTTFAGSGTAGFADGSGLSAQFNNPQGIAVDAKGNIFVADSYNNCIREITPAGVVSTFAGSKTIGYVDGPVATAQFYVPRGLAFDTQGNMYVADFGNNVIRKITPAGIVSTYAGDGTAGFIEATSDATKAEFNSPAGVAVDAAGNLYIADRGNNVIRKVTTAGVVTTLAGSNNGTRTVGYVNATNLVAAFNTPSGIAVDATANLFVSDQVNASIRKVTTPAGVVTTVAGDPTEPTLLNLPSGIAIDSKGNLFITDESGRLLEYTTNNVLYILAGSLNVSGFVNGPGTAAQFNNPQAVAVDASGNIYVADQGNSCIRKITVTTTP
jgi:sugar lactone lactonase YvrE